MATNGLLTTLRDGKVALGLGMMYPAAGIIEGMCRGWDFVWIDAQHGQFTPASALSAVQAAAATGVETLLRVPGHEHSTLATHADLAPSAIMVPMVNSAAEAEAVVAGLTLPPRGVRSYGGRRVIDLYGRRFHEDYELMIVVQIETPEGLDNVEAIAATEGVDCLFFGPDDMKLRMGLGIETAVADSPALQEAMRRTAAAARKAGVFCGFIAPDVAGLKAGLDMGYRMVVGGADVSFLRTQAAARLAEFRSALDARGAAPQG